MTWIKKSLNCNVPCDTKFRLFITQMRCTIFIDIMCCNLLRLNMSLLLFIITNSSNMMTKIIISKEVVFKEQPFECFLYGFCVKYCPHGVCEAISIMQVGNLKKMPNDASEKYLK